MAINGMNSLKSKTEANLFGDLGFAAIIRLEPWSCFSHSLNHVSKSELFFTIV